ncbi:hypothetical protein NLM33_17590 [Bradyrhizobium sp. CCGUVB1N3]|uniref:hypothetical protein n=1 Tax=Bradyrhizobium sp. CCGUVB1N3 TaxID=2949629 RepID=UPI0020B27C14|nr:hypothetical protein [Bradyrhizobium sp. CCGUVB1N3]MCP3472129.1 hypothetical protein [Bradyrhizobium sp. CCGUVB1N3]
MPNSQYVVGRHVFYSPNYEQYNIRFVIPNFWTPQVAFAPFEVMGDAGRQILGFAFKIGSTYHQATINGRSNYTTGVGDPWIITDPHPVRWPANTPLSTFTYDFCPVGIRRPVSYNPIQAKYGDGWAQSPTDSLGEILHGGAIPTPAFGATAPGPLCIVAQGAPTMQPVGLVLGDSLDAGANTNIANQVGSRANMGFWPIGLDDDTPGVGRIPFAMFAVGSTNFFSITRDQFTLRQRLLAALGYPFTFFANGHGQNQISGGGFKAVKAAADTSWAYQREFRRPDGSTFKNIIRTLQPLVQDVSNSKFSAIANQATKPLNTFPSGERYLYNDYARSLPPNVDACIDTSPAWTDLTFPDKFKALGRESRIKLAVSSGIVIMVSGAPPLVGDDIVIGADAAGAFVRNVGKVAPSGSDWIVEFSVGEAAISTEVIAGAIVRATPTRDGIHMTGPVSADGAKPIIEAKAAGVFSL